MNNIKNQLFENFKLCCFVLLLYEFKYQMVSVEYANEAKWIAHSAENLYKLGNSPRARKSLVRPSRPGA